MIIFSDIVTVVDFLDSGACIDGVKRYVASNGMCIAGYVSDLKSEAKKIVNGNGDGYGYGYGDGNGNGYGYGDGDGYGYGYGDSGRLRWLVAA